MKLTKRPEADGTFTILNSKGDEVARGLPEAVADAQIGAEADADGKSAKGSGRKSGN